VKVRRWLADLARLPSVPSGLAKQARIVLLAVDRMPNAQITRTVGVSRPTVIGWRTAQAGGLKGSEDEPRSGCLPQISEADVVVATLVNVDRPLARPGDHALVGPVPGTGLGISFASGPDLVQVGNPAAPG
jgi:hypothetical protein